MNKKAVLQQIFPATAPDMCQICEIGQTQFETQTQKQAKVYHLPSIASFGPKEISHSDYLLFAQYYFYAAGAVD